MRRLPKDFGLHEISLSADNRDVLHVIKSIDSGNLLIYPVEGWDTPRKSSLIESMLLRIPLGDFYIVDGGVNTRKRVLDGTNRLTAIMQFYHNLFELEGVVDALEGKTFDKLNTQLKRRFEDTFLSIYRVRSTVSEEVLLSIYERVNKI